MKDFQFEFKRYNDTCFKHQMSRGLYAEDLNILLEHVEKLPSNSTYVEIGVADGSSLITVSQFRLDILCYGIEIRENPVLKKVIEIEDPANAIVLYGDSTEICKRWDKEIDLLFIDSEHTFPQIFYDFAGWEPFVKKDSWILFHDYENKERNGAKFEVYHVAKLFRNNPRYELIISSEDENISSSILRVKKLCE